MGPRPAPYPCVEELRYLRYATAYDIPLSSILFLFADEPEAVEARLLACTASAAIPTTDVYRVTVKR